MSVSMDAAPFRFRATLRVQHSALARRFAWVSLGAAVVPPISMLLLVAVFGNSGNGLMGYALAMIWLAGWFVVSPLAFVGSWLAGRTWTRGHPCVVEVSPTGIVADEGRLGTWPSDAIESAVVLERAGFAALEIVPKRGANIVFDTSNDGDALAALGALDLGVRNERISIRFGRTPVVALLVSLAAAVGFALSIAFLLAFADGPTPRLVTWLAAFISFIVPAFVFRLVSGGRLVAGTDGIRVVKPFRTKFIPTSTIAGVSALDGIRIARTDGTHVRVANVDGDHIVAFIDHVERLATAHEPNAAILGRGARSIAEWRAALMTVSASGGYRDASLGVDALLDVATSPGPIDRRLGAAIALAKSDDATRTRVRVAASALAGERARVAMESAIDGDVDDDTLERALEEAKAQR